MMSFSEEELPVRTPAFAVLVARGGKLLVRRCWGAADRELGVSNAPHTRFHIASVSKSSTAAVILANSNDNLLALIIERAAAA